MDRRSFIAAGLAAVIVPPFPLFAQQCPGHGQFIGELDLRALPGGRLMKLLQPYGYVDAAGLVWNVPAGVELDGASIPQAFWSITGGPWDGPYRNASVIHDWYCNTHSRPWRDVHRMFHAAMLANCTSRVKAAVMFAAVWAAGPKWNVVDRRNLFLSARMAQVASDYALPELAGDPPAAPEMSVEQFQALAARIEREDLERGQIETLIDR